jgi:N-acetylmuramoyl-L-alanine amidase
MKTRTGILGRIALATALACIVVSSAQARTVKQKKQAAKAQFEVAERLRDSLLGTPDSQRERGDYQKVMDAYRKVYYTAPSWVKADEAVLAVAELLDDQGRVLNDSKSYKDAIGQLAFLRREYPGSRHRVEALFTIAQIYRDDLNDRDQAIATFQDFLKHYPQSTLAPKARQAMVELGNAEAGDPFRPKSARSKHAPHRKETEREAKAAWADVHPSAQAAEKSAEKTKNSDQPKNRSEEKEPAEAKNRKPAPEDTPAADEATADASQSSAPVPVEDVSATPPKPGMQAPAGSRLPRLTSIRHWSTPDYVRVAIDLEQEVKYQAGRVAHPDRIFFDLYGVKLAPDLVGKTFDVEAGFLHRIRVAQNRAGMARVVLDVDDVAEYSAFLLPNPYRLIIDIHGKLPPAQVAGKGKGKKPSTQDVVPEIAPPAPSDVAANDVNQPQGKKEKARAQERQQGASQDNSDIADAQAQNDDVTIRNVKPAATAGDSAAALRKAGESKAGPMKGLSNSSSAPAEVAKADTTKMVVDDSGMDADTGDTSKATTTKVTSGPTYQAIAPEESSRNRKNNAGKSGRQGREDKKAAATTTHVASPTANGDRSLIRALGLKIGKIVVDAGHGGHDTGTIGPNGLQEKDLVLDVALKLGKLLENKLGAEVVYTRDDDTFIPLETRTAIANKEQADLFISIHANSSSDQTARGVETYYLNFTSSRDALEVAARENAVSEKSIHELQDLVKKIALKEKIEESREFAADVQKSLYAGLNARNPGERNRGVKKAPFVVLIGANMPSILAEISFVSNPRDEKKLKTNVYRQQIAESLYKGVAKYINGLSGVRVAAGLERQDASAGPAAALK